jgi:hypothetical protein
MVTAALPTSGTQGGVEAGSWRGCCPGVELELDEVVILISLAPDGVPFQIGQ